MADDKKKNEGNLVETGTILFLVAVGLAVVLPGVGTVFHKKAQRENFARCQANLLRIHEALDQYAKDHEGRLPKFLGELTPKPLEQIPLCPEVNKPTYSDKGYKVSQGNPGRYTVFCFGSAHGEVGVGLNHPYYDSLYGLKPPLGVGVEEKP